MKTLLNNGSIFRIGEFSSTHTKLPVGNYILRLNEIEGYYYLEQTQPFSLPSKLYGDFSICDRWQKSFENTSKNLGILLAGYKGAGKTILAEKFCKKMNIPVILITKGYTGPAFESFISDPMFSGCIVFIDEFEKVYNEEEVDSDSLLTLMDGIYNTHLIFLLTVNNENRINSKLKNRLGRIKYRKTDNSVPKEIVEDVIEDCLENKEFLEDTKEVLYSMPILSFDILMTVINESNLFNEAPSKFIDLLNLVPETIMYDCTFKCEHGLFDLGMCSMSWPRILNLNYADFDALYKYDKDAYEKYSRKHKLKSNMIVHLGPGEIEIKLDENVSIFLSAPSENYGY